MSLPPLEVYTVDVDGVAVEVSIARRTSYPTDSGWHDVVGVRAPSPGCGELTIDVVPGTAWFGLGKNRFVTGVAAFDDHYEVTTSDERVAPWWFGAAEAEVMAASYERTATTPFQLRLEPGVVNLGSTHRSPPGATAAREPLLVRRVDEAVRAVGFIAGRNHRLAAQWQALLTPLGLVDAGAVWRTDDAYALVVERGRARITIDFPWRVPALAVTGLRTRLAIAWPDDGTAAIWPRTWSRRQRPRLSHDRSLELVTPWHGVERFPSAVARLPALGPSLTAAGVDWLLAGDGALAIGWERIVDAPDQLAAGLGLLARWAEHAGGATGPYR